MAKFNIVTFACLILIASSAKALDSASLLPDGIRSPMFRYGIVSGVDEKFTSDGTLMTLTDYNAKEFDAEELQSQDPRAAQLVTLLNSFQNGLGDSLNLGVLKIESKPEIRYFAPVLAYGVTNKITVAAAFPIFNYTNHIQLTESGSNAAQIQAVVNGAIPEVDSAMVDLRAGIAAKVSQSLEQKGYKPLQNRDEQIAGDMQLVALYNFMNTKNWVVTSRTTFNAPTGPKDDPDDLTDLNMFGETAIEPSLILNHNYDKNLQLAAKAQYRYTIPDQAVMRVPIDENDGLPAANRKENLWRDLGNTVTVGASFFYKMLIPGFRAGLGLEHAQKTQDTYSGGRGWRYDLLSKNTDNRAERLRAGLEYSSTESYLKGKALLPLMVNYDFSETFAGRNTEHRMLHEFSLTLFF
jgi:hypothetical protein